MDALIVGITAQDRYLGKRKYTRKIVLLTDGENPIEIENWELAADKMNDLKIKLTVVYVALTLAGDMYAHHLTEVSTSMMRSSDTKRKTSPLSRLESLCQLIVPDSLTSYPAC